MLNDKAVRDIRKLAKYLEDRVVDEGFDLTTFYNFRHGMTQEQRDEADEFDEQGYDGSMLAFKEGFCMTTACAWGYAPSVFPKQVQLSVVRDDEKEVMFVVNGKEFDSGFNAAAEFFGDMNAVAWVFDPSCYAEWPMDREAVIKRLRVLAKHRGRPPFAHKDLEYRS